jgi:hypothetical protein
VRDIAPGAKGATTVAGVNFAVVMAIVGEELGYWKGGGHPPETEGATLDERLIGIDISRQVSNARQAFDLGNRECGELAKRLLKKAVSSAPMINGGRVVKKLNTGRVG